MRRSDLICVDKSRLQPIYVMIRQKVMGTWDIPGSIVCLIVLTPHMLTIA
jgi:hypothetical protein